MLPQSPPSERKNYILDTSVLAYHGESIHNFPGHNVYLPIEVLEELDNLKVRLDQTGAACRYVNRYLDKVREKGNLFHGVEIDGEQVIYVTSQSDLSLLPAGMSETNDNRIISVAKRFLNSGRNATVVSRDISLRVRCDSLEIPAINYDKGSRDAVDYFYEGVDTVEVFKEEIDQFYKDEEIVIPGSNFHPNQGILLKSGQSSALAIAQSATRLKKLKHTTGRDFSVEGVKPRSAEQVFALELLLDTNVHMVSLSGMAGCGKTLLSIAAAISMIHQSKYKKLILSRPVQSTSKDIGFLPGTKEEKLMPWLQPFFDNLEVIFDKRGKAYIDMLMKNGTIEMEALTYIRGRTLPDTIFIIDEAQNITHHEAKALLTRMGENSKIILIGDLEQIDSPTVDEKTSGLSSVVSLFKDFEHSGHIRLRKGERSKLATYAAKVM